MKRFYINADFTPDEIIQLPPNVVQHMQVLRVKDGEIIELFDGVAYTYQGAVISLDRRVAKLKIIKKSPIVPGTAKKISLAIANVANDKMDLIIQKAVELGVNNIIPVYSEHAKRLILSRSTNRLKHWQQIIISSCCQCGQNRLPEIILPISLNSLYSEYRFDVKIIMHPQANLVPVLPQDLAAQTTCGVLLVGPEGGFTVSEIELAHRHNYQSLQLGNLIMRTETAVFAGLTALNLHLKNWS